MIALGERPAKCSNIQQTYREWVHIPPQESGKIIDSKVPADRGYDMLVPKKVFLSHKGLWFYYFVQRGVLLLWFCRFFGNAGYLQLLNLKNTHVFTVFQDPTEGQYCWSSSVQLLVKWGKSSYCITENGLYNYIYIYLGCGPLPVRVTTRMITFRLGNLYKLPSFTIVTGRGPHPNHIFLWFIQLLLACLASRTWDASPSHNDLPNFLLAGSEAQAQLSLTQRLGGEDPKVITYVYKYIYVYTYARIPGLFLPKSWLSVMFSHC